MLGLQQDLLSESEYTIKILEKKGRQISQFEDVSFNAGAWYRLNKAILHIHINVPDINFKEFEVALNDVILGRFSKKDYTSVYEIDCTAFLRQGDNKLKISWICHVGDYCMIWIDYLLVQLKVDAILFIPPPPVPEISLTNIILIMFGIFLFLWGVSLFKGR